MPRTVPPLQAVAIYILIAFSCLAYGMIFSINLKIGIVLFGVILVLALFFFRLDYGLFLIFFFIPFDRLTKLNPDGILTLPKVLIALLLIVWAVKTLVTRDQKPILIFRDNPVLVLSLLFLVFSISSFMAAHKPDVFMLILSRRLNLVILLFIIINIIDRKELLIKFLTIIILAYVFVGMTGIYEIATGDSILKTYWGEEVIESEYVLTTGESRVAGPAGDPDFHASSIIFPTLASLTFLFMFKSKRAKILICLFLLLMMINLLGTGSRGGLISLVLGLSVFWFFLRMRWKYTIAAVSIASFILVSIVFSIVSPNAPTERYTGEVGGKSIVYRIGWTKMALSIIKKHPIGGVGTGNFVAEYNKYLRERPEVPRSPYWTHNSYLQMWAENGIFGLLVFVSIYIVCIWRMLTVVRKTGDERLRYLALLFLAVVSAYAIFSASSNIIQNENFWTVFALTIVVYNLYREETNKENGLKARPPIPWNNSAAL